MTYFVSLLNFDQKHQRSNPLNHSSILIYQGDINENDEITHLKELDSYAFYSHEISEDHLSKIEWFLNKIFNVTFKLFGSYAVIQREKLHQIDASLGITCTPLIGITEEEKVALEKEIANIFIDQERFFSEADHKTALTIEHQGVTNPKLYNQIKNSLREKYYQEAVDAVNTETLDPDFLIEKTALASHLISKRRFQQEKVRAETGIEFFELALNPNGNTCRPTAIKLLLNILDSNGPGIKRKLYLSALLNHSYHEYAVPRLLPDLSRLLVDSTETSYQVTSDEPHFPQRSWENPHVNKEVIACENNHYINAEGKICLIATNPPSKDLILMLENLILLKRLINDYIDVNREKFENFIRIIEEAIRLCRNCEAESSAVYLYHRALKTLAEQHCFEIICKDIFKTEKHLAEIRNLNKLLTSHHTKLEQVLSAEVDRFKQMEQQGKKPDLTLQDLHPKSWFSSFLGFFKKSPQVKEEIEMQPLSPFSNQRQSN